MLVPLYGSSIVIALVVYVFLGWLALMLIGRTLIGMLARGLVLVADAEKQLSENDDLRKIVKKDYNLKLKRRVNNASVVLIIIYLSALFYFSNIGVVVVAVMLMVAQIPHLLWVANYWKLNIKAMLLIHLLTRLIYIATFPGLWYAFYHIKIWGHL